MDLFRENFKKILKEKGMTQLQVSQSSGVGNTILNRMLKHGQDTKLSTLFKIAHGLGVNAWQLLLPIGGKDIGPLNEEEKRLIFKLREVSINNDKLYTVIENLLDSFSQK